MSIDMISMKNSMALMQNTISKHEMDMKMLHYDNKKLQDQIVSMNVAFHYLNVINDKLRNDLQMQIYAIGQSDVTDNDKPFEPS